MSAKPWNRGKRGWYVKYNHGGEAWGAKAGDGTEQEAIEIADAWNAARKGEKEARRPAGPKPFDALVRMWWDAKWSKVADTTRENWQRDVKLLLAALGRTDARKLNDRAVSNLAEGFAEQGYAAESIRTFGRTFSNILNWAVEEEVLDERPCRKSPSTLFGEVAGARGAPPRNDSPAWNPEEADALLRAALEYGQHFADCALFAFHTGCRVGELVALEWNDVDLHKRVVTIRQSRSRQKVKGTKNTKIRKTDLLSPEVNEMLARRKRERLPRFEHVFLNYSRKPWQAKDISTIWTRDVLALRPDVRGFPWHSWRHTWASLAIEAGNAPAWCAKQIGDKPATFWERYFHYIDRKTPRVNFLTAGPFAVPAPEMHEPPVKTERSLRLVRPSE